MADKENNRKCFKCGCSPAVDKVKLFRFPKPAIRNLERCELWAQFIFPERDYSSASLQEKLHSEHRMLCQNHFKDSDFTDCTKQYLTRTAVPCDGKGLGKVLLDREFVGILEERPRKDVHLMQQNDRCPQATEIPQTTTMARQTTPKIQMRCCVPLCSSDADRVSRPAELSFHMFPDAPALRNFWLEALDLTEWHRQNPEAINTAVVCSEHFAAADLYMTKSGFQKLRTGAVPMIIQETLEDEVLSDEEMIEQLQVCRICLETESRLISISDTKLGETYQNLAGFSMSDDERLSKTLCPECMQRLRNFDKFRQKCLTADLLLTNILKKSDGSIKEEFMKIERAKLGLTSDLVQLFINYDHFDLFIQEDSQNAQNHDYKQITNQSNIELDELTVLNFNRPNVSGASIKIDKVRRVASKPNVASGFPRLAPKPLAPMLAPIPNTPSNLQKIAPKRNFTPNFQKIASKINMTPITQTKREIDTKMRTDNKSTQKTYFNKRIMTNTVSTDSNQTMNVNKLITGNQVKVKNDSVNNEQANKVKVDYIPVIDVVLDNKFKIVRKEDVLLKNAQIIISDNKPIPTVQELDNHKAIVRNKHGIPIGIDLSKSCFSVPKTEQVLPIMTKDRIIMPNQDVHNDVPTPQHKPFQQRGKMITKTVQTEGTPTLRNVTNKRIQQIKTNTKQVLQQDKPKNILINQQNEKEVIQEKSKNIPTSVEENRENVPIAKISQKHMPILDDDQNNMPIIDNEQSEVDNNQIITENEHLYGVPESNYEQEVYEESVEETVVTEDYLEMQSESDNEMDNIKKEVEDIIKEDKDNSSNAYTEIEIGNFDETNQIVYKEDQENNETWDENQDNNETGDVNQENNETWDENQGNNETCDGSQGNNETWDENQDNSETWEENQENNENSETWDENQESNDIWNDNNGKWEPDDFSEDNDNYQNSEFDQHEETTDSSKIDKFNPETMKKTRMHRRRKSMIPNYGKMYFSDDLNEVIFTIQHLTFEEQLIEIKNRLHTKYKDAPHSCNLCYRGFMNEYAYNRHMNLHNSEDGEYECGVCRFKFKSARHVEAHQAARHATKFSCNLCEFTTTSIEPAKQHGMKHRGIRYQCPYCPEEYLRYTVLMDHMAIKHTPENLCPVCGLKLVSDNEVERHMSVRHPDLCDQEQWTNAVHCERCDMLFASEEGYRFHLGVSIKHDSEFIMEHQRAKRNQEMDFSKPPSQYKKAEVVGPLTCEQCGVKLPTLRKYHAHFRREHPDKTRTFYPTMTKKVMCELCGRFLKAQWQYVEHLRLHTNERPFSCEHCGKSFVNNRLLCTHRYVHGVGRARPDIKCKLCGKTFANRGNLHRHMGIHNDEKRFKCEICNTMYRQKAEMKSHYDHVHLRIPWPKRHRPKRDESTIKSAPTSEDDTSQQYVVEEVAEEMEIDY